MKLLVIENVNAILGEVLPHCVCVSKKLHKKAYKKFSKNSKIPKQNNCQILNIRIFETLTEECCKYFNVVKMQHKSACFLLTPKSKKDTRKINLYKMYRVCNKVKKMLE